MAVAGLIAAITALLCAVVPMVYTQLLGVVLGLTAAVFCVLARRQSRGAGRPTRMATAGVITGVLAALIGGALYGIFVYSAGRLGDQIVRKVGSEFERTSERGGAEFRQAVEQALKRAQQRQPGSQPHKKAAPGTERPAGPGAAQPPR